VSYCHAPFLSMSDRKFPFSSPADATHPPAPGGVYLADSSLSAFAGGAEEVLRAMNISVLGAAGAGSATFLPDLGDDASAVMLAEAWDGWLRGLFATQIGAAFCRVHAAVGEMRIDEILRADQDIDAALEEQEKQRSLEAAQAFLEGREAIRHMPQFARLATAIHNSDSPGHVTTLFAMQAGLYHLPRLGALVSYAYFEWHGGAVAASWNGDRSMAFFEQQNPQTASVVRSLIRDQTATGESGESSIFCVD
jgi:hypothetical protein